MDVQVTRSSANASERGLLAVLAAVSNAAGAGVISDPGLRIDGGSGAAIVEAETAFYTIAGGVLILTAAGTNMPALVGTVPTDEFGLFVWTMDSAGTITQATLAQAATLAALTIPYLPTDQAVVGALLIAPTGTGSFVGGTTDIDDATVVPAAVFFDGHNMAIGNRVVFPGSTVPAIPSS